MLLTQLWRISFLQKYSQFPQWLALLSFFKKVILHQLTYDLIIKETLKLNSNEEKYLDFDLNSRAYVFKSLSKSTALDFEENDFLEDNLEVIMCMCFKDNDDTESKIINFKLN